jgi:hypothetical protein
LIVIHSDYEINQQINQSIYKKQSYEVKNYTLFDIIYSFEIYSAIKNVTQQLYKIEQTTSHHCKVGPFSLQNNVL